MSAEMKLLSKSINKNVRVYVANVKFLLDVNKYLRHDKKLPNRIVYGLIKYYLVQCAKYDNGKYRSITKKLLHKYVPKSTRILKPPLKLTNKSLHYCSQIIQLLRTSSSSSSSYSP